MVKLINDVERFLEFLKFLLYENSFFSHFSRGIKKQGKCDAHKFKPSKSLKLAKNKIF